VPDEREPARLIGLGLKGSWIELEPLDESNAGEFAQFDMPRQLDPLMGEVRRAGPDAIAPPMIIRDLASGRAVGLVENHIQPGGVVAFVIYFDRSVGRAGTATEAMVLYISHLFDSGARLVSCEVLEPNPQVIRIIHKLKFEPQARMRDHLFSAGRFWDLLVYSFDQQEWIEKAVNRYRRILPGGDRKPAAIGPSRPRP